MFEKSARQMYTSSELSTIVVLPPEVVELYKVIPATFPSTSVNEPEYLPTKVEAPVLPLTTSSAKLVLVPTL